MTQPILCVGEVLWDALPDGLFLGGAPFNVACHLQALGARVAFASRVGDDRLGAEVVRRMQARGLDPALVQTDPALPTGFVQVELGTTGDADYEILEPAAWDAIAPTAALDECAGAAAAIVFGSLAQRAPTSRKTIRRLCERGGAAGALRVFDINLRAPFVERPAIEASLRAADVVKLNEDELGVLREWFGLPADPEPALAGLAEAVGARAVCMTCGSEGAWLWTADGCRHHPGYDVAVADTVGAGDAFLAALLRGLLGGQQGEDLLDLANRLGAYVASRSGALPAYRLDALADVEALSLSQA
jgi:fructokinase